LSEILSLIRLIMPKAGQKFYEFTKKRGFGLFYEKCYCAWRRSKSRQLRPRRALTEKRIVRLLLMHRIIRARSPVARKIFRQDNRIILLSLSD
jgi:hypothetical protein